MAGHKANIGDKAEHLIERPKPVTLDVKMALRGDEDLPELRTIQLKAGQWVPVLFGNLIVSVRLK